MDHKDVLGALNNSLSLLGTDYVDLCGRSPRRDWTLTLLTRCRFNALACPHDQRLESRQIFELARYLEGDGKGVSGPPRESQGNRCALSLLDLEQ